MTAKSQDLRGMKTMIKRTYFTMDDCNIGPNTLKGVFGLDHADDIANMLYIRFRRHWMIFEDQLMLCGHTEDAEPSQEKVEAFLDKAYYIYLATFKRYSKLLDLYASYENKLMDGLTDSSIVRFNDTPQDQGDFADDQHTTNITQSSSLRDVESVMDKLDGAARKYRDLMHEWTNEFMQLFGEEI